jgi:hypothetical protein
MGESNEFIHIGRRMEQYLFMLINRLLHRLVFYFGQLFQELSQEHKVDRILIRVAFDDHRLMIEFFSRFFVSVTENIYGTRLDFQKRQTRHKVVA